MRSPIGEAAARSRRQAAPRPGHVYPPLRRAGFAAAGMEHVFAGWQGATATLEQDLRAGLVRMRARSRALARDNDYMKHFLGMVQTNVVGHRGVRLQVRAVEPNGKPDASANELIEAAWSAWGKAGTCTADGRLSWLQVQALAMQMIARDGEVLIRLLPGFRNGYGFALQVIAADALDETYNTGLSGGREVRMGVEVDEWNRPQAYHLRTREMDRYASRHVRVPASQMLHLYRPDDTLQSRGLPWVHAGVRRLGMLGGFEEAAVTNARVGAGKMGFFTSLEGGSFAAPDGEDGEGFPTIVSEPGSYQKLPPGYDFKAFDPAYPNGETAPFVKVMLRGVAAGLGVSYTSLANDLEGVNLSSIRAGLLEERAMWMALQEWLVEVLHGVVFAEWLTAAMISRAVALPVAKYDKFNQPQWYPRRWAWTDPVKEMDANERAVAMGLTSRTALAAEQGRDFREVMAEQAAEQAVAQGLGITLGTAASAKPAQPAPATPAQEDDPNGQTPIQDD